jgi:hypothetical protein
MTEPPHDPRLAALEAALARLPPPPAPFNRDQLLFRAGQAVGHCTSWAWRCATAAALLLSAGLGLALVWRPEPRPGPIAVSPLPTVPAPAAAPVAVQESPAPDTSPLPPQDTEPEQEGPSYLQLRGQVLAHGADALPAPTPWRANGPQVDHDGLLGLPPGAAGGPWWLRLKNSSQSGNAS